MNAELLDAARKLGQALQQTQEVQSFLAARQAVEAEAELLKQEEQMLSVYQALVTRQQAGEELKHQEVQEFYRLRDEVQYHPLIKARETALAAVKSLFSQAGGEITGQIGVEFTSLALAGPVETEGE